MKTTLKAKYYSYILIALCLISLPIQWFSLFSLALALAGILLGIYAILSLKNKRNLFSSFPKGFHYTIRTLQVIFITSFIVVEGLVIHSGQQSPTQEPDYIIVLGAAIKDGQPTQALAYRLDKAHELYLQYPNSTIICSGGVGANQTQSEASVMQQYLLKKGVPSSSILLEEKSTTTAENLNNSKLLMQGSNPKVALVTNNFHMYRASLMADKLEIDSFNAPAKQMNRSSLLSYLREYPAVLYYVIFH